MCLVEDLQEANVLLQEMHQWTSFPQSGDLWGQDPAAEETTARKTQNCAKQTISVTGAAADKATATEPRLLHCVHIG